MRYLHIRLVGTTSEYGPRDLPGFQYVFVQANSEKEAERSGNAILPPIPDKYYEMNWLTVHIPE